VTKDRCFIAIDPGLTGAIALYAPSLNKRLDVADLPTKSIGKGKGNKVRVFLDVIGIHALICAFHDTALGRDLDPVAIIEHVAAAPGQGVSSAFTFGRTYGVLFTLLQVSGLPVAEVTPRQWKRQLFLGGQDKAASMAMARQLFPINTERGEFDRKKDHNRAEAALLAYWASKHF
jgi:hypothetical protein